MLLLLSNVNTTVHSGSAGPTRSDRRVTPCAKDETRTRSGAERSAISLARGRVGSASEDQRGGSWLDCA
jgi:hypothetical protein